MSIDVKVFVCVPTFREPRKTELFLASLKFVNYSSVEVVVINANGPDESSIIINEYSQNLNYKLTEIFGKSDEFWSASVNRGLRYIEENCADVDLIIVANIDIEFSSDIITTLVDRLKLLGNCQVGAIALSKGTAISSGVVVRSWALTLNRHPFAGLLKDSLPTDVICPVHFLPGRCFIFPVSNLKVSGLIDEMNLPHYGGDYEFSYRLSNLGCPAFIDSSVMVFADMENTGLSIYDNRSGIAERFSQLWSIKNPSNPYYRMVMVKRMFPFYWIPFGVFFYFLRSFVEVLLGGRLLLRVLNRGEHGFSGSDQAK